MTNNQFCHLHLHSEYSALDGLCKLPDLVSRAKELNQPAIALTEHGNMHSAFNFYKECKKQDIKPIIGIEAYLAKNRMSDKEEDDRQRYHFLLLAENKIGYKNLIQSIKENGYQIIWITMRPLALYNMSKNYI